MSNRVLIDGFQKDNIRVVVSEGDRIVDFDFNSASNDQIKGNMYLAKISRIEPSLQAAFIEYGSVKNGFLPFSEVNLDCFKIDDARKQEIRDKINDFAAKKLQETDNYKAESEIWRYQQELLSEYKIEDVLQRDQTILVQAIKDERGNKGAAFTTYCNIPGRFCIFMPNSAYQGGVSKKIQEDAERDRLKSLTKELSEKYENKASVILRTASEFKTKAEIRRDFQYISKLWENIKSHAAKSKAPCFIHEEGDIIRRAIRDWYNSDVEEILVAGEQAFEETKSFIQLMLPKHVDKVKLYKDAEPLFNRYNVEEKLAALYNNDIQLQSGGSLVIQPTEALVSIDINSGKYTDERNVENTALKINLEAARAIAEQVMLRSLSGLIVIDFIDMKNDDNKAKVEKELKAAFKNDRARTIIGKIGSFGLLEMSRQRIQRSFLESNTDKCPHCEGKGVIRRADLTIASIMRNLNYFLDSNQGQEIKLIACDIIIMQLMRDYKAELVNLEAKFKSKIVFEMSDEFGGDGFFIEDIKSDYKTKSNIALSGVEDAEYNHPKHKNKRHDDRKKPRSETAPASDITSDKKSNDDLEYKSASDGQRQNEKQQKRSPQRRKRVDNSRKSQKTDSKRRYNDDRDDKRKSDENTSKRNEDKSLLKGIWRKIID